MNARQRILALLREMDRTVPEARAIRGDLWQHFWAWLSYGAVQLAFRRHMYGLMGNRLKEIKARGRLALDD